MWYFIQTIIISFLFILMVHFLWNYIKDTYSTKKTKDLVGIQTQKYKSILEEVIQNKNNPVAEEEPQEEVILHVNEDELTQYMEQQMLDI
jgi:hypothetical protein